MNVPGVCCCSIIWMPCDLMQACGGARAGYTFVKAACGARRALRRIHPCGLSELPNPPPSPPPPNLHILQLVGAG